MTAEARNLRIWAIAAYILIGIGGMVLSVVGVVLAYVKRGDGGPLWDSHFLFQIRSFWFGLLFFVIGMLVWPLGLAELVWGLAWLWLVVRMVIGGVKALSEEPVPAPRSLLLGL